MPPSRYRPRRGPRPQRKRTGAAPGRRPDRDRRPCARPAPVELPNPVVVKDFAETLGVSHAEIINVLIRNGIFATVNQSIDFDTASLVAGELGFETTERGRRRARRGRGGRRARSSSRPAAPGEGDGKPRPVDRRRPGASS